MLSNYIKIAWKVLGRHPFYTFITLFGISLTLTVLMVLTSFIDHLVGSHYPEVNRGRSLYVPLMTQTDSMRSGLNRGPMSFKFLTTYAKSLRTPEHVTIFSFFVNSNAYANGHKISISMSFTDAEFWEVNRFTFLEGKPYTDQQIRQGDRVAVISDAFRRQYFNSAQESVLGQTIEIENLRYRVVGVVKGSPITRIFTHAEVYFPYTAPKSNYQAMGMRGRYVAILQARTAAELPAMRDEFQRRIGQIPLPAKDGDFKFSVLEVKSEPYAENFISTFLDGRSGTQAVAIGVLSFVLFMLVGLPAINLVNVNVSRMLERASEIGIRKAFGAPVHTLVWQFIIENIFITLIGGAIALLFSFGIVQFINHSGWIVHADLAINGTVFLISLLICLLFGLLSGVLPALRMSKLTIADALKA